MLISLKLSIIFYGEAVTEKYLFDTYPIYDYLGDACTAAKKYMAEHPEADSRAVYAAAQNAAMSYEYSEELRLKPFKLVLAVAIRTADYNSRRKEEEMAIKPRVTDETVEAIRRDLEEGELNRLAISEKYGVSTTTIGRIAQGKIHPSSGNAPIKAVPKPEKEKSPEPVKVEFFENGFPVDYEEQKEEADCKKEEPEEICETIENEFEDDGVNFFVMMNELVKFAMENISGAYVLEQAASNLNNCAGIHIADGSGRRYTLKLEERKEEK